MHYIEGTTLIRLTPGPLAYRRERFVYEIDELFSNPVFGQTANEDYQLCGCCVSFIYENEVEKAQVEEDQQKICAFYKDYLEGYTLYDLYDISKFKDVSKDPSARILFCGVVKEISEVRQSIIAVLEHFGSSTDKLKDFNKILKSAEVVLSMGTHPDDIPNLFQTAVSFEEEMDSLLERLSGHLRFLFFVPLEEYNNIWKIHRFLPRQVKSVLCVRSFGSGKKPLGLYIKDKVYQDNDVSSFMSSIDYMFTQLSKASEQYRSGQLEKEQYEELFDYLQTHIKALISGNQDLSRNIEGEENKSYEPES